MNNENTIIVMKNGMELIYAEAIKHRPLLLEYIPESDQTEDICELAITLDAEASKFVINKSDRIINAIIKKNPSYVFQLSKKECTPERYILGLRNVPQHGYLAYWQLMSNIDKNEELIELFMEKEGLLLKNIKDQDQTLKQCHCAVKSDGLSLKYVVKRHKTPEVCLAAVRHNGDALKFVDPEDMTDDIVTAAISRRADSIQYVPANKQTIKIINAAILKDPNNLRFIRDQSEDICMKAIKYNPRAFSHVKIQTPKLCVELIKMKPQVFSTVREHGRVFSLGLIKYNRSYFEKLNLQTEEVCIEAIKLYGKTIGGTYGYHNRVYKWINNDIYHSITNWTDEVIFKSIAMLGTYNNILKVNILDKFKRQHYIYQYLNCGFYPGCYNTTNHNSPTCDVLRIQHDVTHYAYIRGDKNNICFLLAYIRCVNHTTPLQYIIMLISRQKKRKIREYLTKELIKICPKYYKMTNTDKYKMVDHDMKCIKACPSVILYMKNPSVKNVQAAVKLNGLLIEKVKKTYLNDKLYMMAVGSNGYALKHIPSTFITQEMCNIAVKTTPGALIHVSMLYQTPEICQIAINHDPLNLQYVIVNEERNKLELCAVTKNGEAIRYAKNQTEELCILAVRRNGNNIAYIRKPSSKVWERAIKKTPHCIRHMTNGNVKLIKYALNKDPSTAKYLPLFVDNMEEKHCDSLHRLAISLDIDNIIYAPERLRDVKDILRAIRNKPILMNDLPCSLPIEIINENEYHKFIRYVPDELLTEKICNMAIDIDERLYTWCSKLTDKVRIARLKYDETYALQNYISLKNDNEIIAAMRHMPKIYIEKLTRSENILRETVKYVGITIKDLDKPTYDDWKNALKIDGLLLVHNVLPDIELCKIAINQNPMALLYVPYQTEELCKIALKDDKNMDVFLDEKFRYLIPGFDIL